MTTYYVSTTGNDNGSGTQSSPWHTINHALQSSLKPGDTVVVEPGTYNEAISINQSGSAAGNITLQSQVPGGALIRPPAGTYNAVNINANYVTIDGFDIKGGSGDGIQGNSVHHVSVLNNVVHDSGESGIQFNYSEFETITGNTTYNNASSGWYSGISIYENRNITGDTTTQGFRTIVSNNVSYDNVTKTGAHTDGNGIIIDDFQSTQASGHPNYTYPTLVEGNLVYGNGGKGVQVTWSDYVTVRNNTAYHNNQDTANTGTWRGEISNSQSSNNTFVNNIAVADPKVNPNNTAIANTSDGGYTNKNVVWADNITFNGASGQASVKTDGGNAMPSAANGNMLGVDPKFVQPGVDFHLQSSSPAIDSGTSAYGLGTTDLNGHTLASGAVDIGAIETGGATSASTGSGATSAPTGSGTTSTSTGSGTTSAGDGNTGVNHGAHTWHDARAAFHDAISTSANDWNATKAAAFQNALTGHGVSRGTLQNAQKVMNLLNGVDTTDSTQVSAVNAQTGKVQSQTVNTVNHDVTPAAQTVGADGSTGDPGLHHDFSFAVHHLGHLWG